MSTMKQDYVIVVIDRFSKIDALNFEHFYFKVIICLNGLPRTITSNRKVKFQSFFGGPYDSKLCMRLQLNSTTHL